MRKWNRVDGIDLLRGFAIFFVLMNHVNMRLRIAKIPFAQGLPHQLGHFLFWNGQPAVQMFFVISGFLITTISIRRWKSLSTVSVRDFYRLRFARIAPLLLLLLAVLSALHFANLRDFVVSAKTGGLGRALLAALTFHVNVLEARRGYLPGNWDILWSLSVEEMFYLFFPLACRTFARWKLFIVLLVGFVVLGPFGRTVFAGGNEVWHEYSYLGSMDAIALGCLTALFASRIRLSRMVLRTFIVSGAAILIFCFGFSQKAYEWGLEPRGLDMTLLAVGACLFIVASSQMDWQAPRALAPLLSIGRFSYEIYLTHMFVVFALFHLFLFVGNRSPIAVFVLFLATIIISALLGAAVAVLYSEPLNRTLRARWRQEIVVAATNLARSESAGG